MKELTNVVKAIPCGLAIAGLAIASIFSPLSAFAGLENSSANFRACVNSKIAKEKKKASPNVEALIAECQENLDALTADLPPGARQQVIHDLKEQLKKKLK